ncbi:MAG: ribose-phosphate pyrophosphokinase [Tissierellia bacterium]|nr:ribose-phosphate pyrophosphokinase [Tissierellia bacterium]
MNFCVGEMKIFTGNSNKPLVQSICHELGISQGLSSVNHFSDYEISVDIGETVRGADIYVVQSTCAPVNDNLMELLIMLDAMKRASAGRVNVVLPYYGYARQDRKTKAREPITAKLVADLIETAGADRIITMDLHAGQIQGYFNIPVDHLSGVQILADHFKSFIDDNTVVVSPDLGGVTRARSFANFLGLPIAIIEKIRPRANVAEVMNLIGDIEGKNAILIDDIIDTAGTIVSAVDMLKKQGALKVWGAATHGVLSGPAITRLQNSQIEQFIITDTIPLPETKQINKIAVTSVAPIIAKAMRRINQNLSVSKLFD